MKKFFNYYIIKGSYRYYFRLFNIGIKVARLNFNNDNVISSFLASVIMNILEYKRFKYYKTNLCETYFTCGFFNIVKHYDKSDEGLLDEDCHYLLTDDKLENFGKLGDKIVLLDYGDFVVNSFNRLNVKLIDYK